MSVATVGARFQVVIPLKERRRAGLKPGQKVNVVLEEGRIVLEPVGTQQLRGLLRETDDPYDAVDYINKLRREWEERS
ncbi:AbrB/MazE/SpoVT family DNA-binding domain-containing protein [bacterium]|nr:AbrB/MazE/SpoVT family DNA-binding domain-containing protein [bacterium]